MKKQYTHGDYKLKADKIDLSGHMYNPSTGNIDSYDADGNFSHVLCQLHEPKPIKKQTLVVGTLSKFIPSYNSGPNEWKNQSVAIWTSKGK